MTANKLPAVGIVSLGCAKNLVDSEVMLGYLARAGHPIASDSEARVVLVNTCGFIDRAKEESVDAILEPVARKQRSRSVASLVAEARALRAQGVAELVLISQDTTRYGEDLGLGRDGLTRLLEALLLGTTFPWIRFLYAFPRTLRGSVLQLMARD